MNSRYSKPSTWRIRPESDRPKTTMKRVDEMTGASTVCVHSFDTRSVSRRASHISPAVPLTRRKLRGADQLPEVVQLARTTVVPALTEVRAHRAKLVGLLLRLDSLGDDVHPKRAGKHHDSTDDRRILGIAADLADERAVDLQEVHLRHLSEVPERGEADAEAVDRQADGDRAERAEAQERRVGIREQRALGHLQTEVARRDAGAVDDVAHVVDEVGVGQLAWGDVDARGQRRARAAHVLDDVAHHPVAERRD